MKAFFTILACIGFWGAMIHPIMIIVFIIGAYGAGAYDCYKKEDDTTL